MRSAAVVVAALALAALSVWGVYGFGLAKEERQSPRSAGSRAWEERIRALGAGEAYAALSSEAKALGPQEQHVAAHDFGSALYRVLGTEGLGICDAQFSFGCYHEFLGRAIADLGLASVAMLNDECFAALTESPLSCQHGIGHGVIAFVGYDDDALFEALDVCRDLPRNDSIGGCYGGVFMEYNLQTMLGTEGRVRPAHEKSLQYPCNVVGEDFSSACYFWQPQWWRQYVRERGVEDLGEVYRQIGSFCRDAPMPYRRTCFEGIGNNLPADAEFDPRRLKEMCEIAGETAHEELYCKLLAANSLSSGGAGMAGDGEAVCDGLEGDARALCIGYARNQLNIAVPGVIE